MYVVFRVIGFSFVHFERTLVSRPLSRAPTETYSSDAFDAFQVLTMTETKYNWSLSKLSSCPFSINSETSVSYWLHQVLIEKKHWNEWCDSRQVPQSFGALANT